MFERCSAKDKGKMLHMVIDQTEHAVDGIS